MRYGLLNDIRKLDEQRYPLMIERFMALAYAPGAALSKPYPRPQLQIDPRQATFFEQFDWILLCSLEVRRHAHHEHLRAAAAQSSRGCLRRCAGSRMRCVADALLRRAASRVAGCAGCGGDQPARFSR